MFLLTFFFTHYLSPLLLPGALLVDRFWPQLHQISKCSSPVPHLRGGLNLWLWAWWTSPSNSYDDKAICKITSWLKPCTEEALDCLWIINQLLTNTCTWFTVPMTFFSLIPRSTPAAPSAYALMSFDAKKKVTEWFKNHTKKSKVSSNAPQLRRRLPPCDRRTSTPANYSFTQRDSLPLLCWPDTKVF